MPSDKTNATDPNESKSIDVLTITGKDSIRISCDPELPTGIFARETDNKQELVINGNSEDGCLLIQGDIIELKADVIHLDANVYFSEPLLTEAQDLAGAINELYRRLELRKAKRGKS